MSPSGRWCTIACVLLLAAVTGLFAAGLARAAGDTLTITPPATSTPGAYFSLGLSGTTAASSTFIDVWAIPSGQTCDATDSQASTDYDTDPFGIGSAYTSGSFNTTALMLIPAAGAYTLCGYLLENATSQTAMASGSVTVAAATTTPPTAPPTPTTPTLACEFPPDISVTAPTSVLGGRRGTFTVTDAGLTTDSDVTYTVAAASSSQPIHFPTSGSLPSASLGEGGAFTGTFQTQAGDGPILITVDWTQTAGDGSTCTRSATAGPITVATTGVPPGLNWETNDAGDAVTFDFTGDCELITPTPATVVLRGDGLVRRFRIPDVCGAWSRSSGPQLPSLAISTKSAGLKAGASLYAAVVGSQNASHNYTLTAKFAGVTRTFRLSASVIHQSTMIVYEGTDAFVNYCIDDYKTVMSLNGQLYCVEPGFTDRLLLVTR